MKLCSRLAVFLTLWFQVFYVTNGSGESSNTIVVIGKTGVGKSYIVNRLINREINQTELRECNSDKSCTTQITTKVAWNGDNVTECPGYFDSEGEDQKHQVELIDFMRNKTIRAVLFVYIIRADSFMQHVATDWIDSDFKQNLIFVKNLAFKLDQGESEVSTYKGITKVHIMANQNDFSVLKMQIDRLKPLVAINLPTPITLFPNPDQLVRREEYRVKMDDDHISKHEVRYRNVTQPVFYRACRFGVFFSRGFSAIGFTFDDCPTNNTYRYRFEYQVDKIFAVEKVWEKQYAKRIDNVIDLVRNFETDRTIRTLKPESKTVLTCHFDQSDEKWEEINRDAVDYQSITNIQNKYVNLLNEEEP